ncbi:MAG: sulfite exporter TauE/SafE family protein [Rhodanobacter sp.]
MAQFTVIDGRNVKVCTAPEQVQRSVMTVDWTTFQVLAVLFFATVIRSAFGFGAALIAVPLLALLMPVSVAVPVAVLISITVAVFLLALDWRHVHVRSAGWLVLSTLAGMPLGLLLLTQVPEGIVKVCLGTVIIAFSGFLLFRRHQPLLTNDNFTPIFGFVAGILGGAYGMNGPPLVLFGTLRGWSPLHFRATLQGYFLPASILTMTGYWLTGLWKPVVTHYYVIALPVVMVAIGLGRVISGRMNERVFHRFVHVGLIVIGTVLVWQSIR